MDESRSEAAERRLHEIDRVIADHEIGRRVADELDLWALARDFDPDGLTHPQRAALLVDLQARRHLRRTPERVMGIARQNLRRRRAEETAWRGVLDLGPGALDVLLGSAHRYVVEVLRPQSPVAQGVLTWPERLGVWHLAWTILDEEFSGNDPAIERISDTRPGWAQRG